MQVVIDQPIGTIRYPDVATGLYVASASGLCFIFCQKGLFSMLLSFSISSSIQGINCSEKILYLLVVAYHATEPT